MSSRAYYMSRYHSERDRCEELEEKIKKLKANKNKNKDDKDFAKFVKIRNLYREGKLDKSSAGFILAMLCDPEDSKKITWDFIRVYTSNKSYC